LAILDEAKTVFHISWVGLSLELGRYLHCVSTNFWKLK
jgi:hypothetical protein